MSTETFTIISIAYEHEDRAATETLEELLNDSFNVARQAISRIQEQFESAALLSINPPTSDYDIEALVKATASALRGSSKIAAKHLEARQALLRLFLRELVDRGCQEDAARELARFLFHRIYLTSSAASGSKAGWMGLLGTRIRCQMPLANFQPTLADDPVVSCEVEFTPEGWVLTAFDLFSEENAKAKYSVESVFSMIPSPKTDTSKPVH